MEEEEEMSLTSAAAPPVTSQPLLFPPATGACTPTHRASWRGPAFIPGRLRAASRGGGGGGGCGGKRREGGRHFVGGEGREREGGRGEGKVVGVRGGLSGREEESEKVCGGGSRRGVGVSL